ncbi:hypothetical protein [Telluribacter sp. SYSU D00476]|uniref:hypothetical protein n=1 Tax=Telluribacter sp. SYSU D00476 TaxID=2811430 RepID=UPI001FF4DFA0|nr:hypothetical protein [Telluribacter sp. SYSU D00476]
MKKLIGLLLLCVSTSCQPSREEVCEKLDVGIKTYFEDLAFKENREIKIYDINTVRFSMVGEGAIDTMKSLYYIKQQDRFINRGVNARKSVQSSLSRYEAMKRLGIELPLGWEEEINDGLNESKAYMDSASYYGQLDSIITIKMRQSTDYKPLYYKTRTFVKATMDKDNLLDTLEFILNKDFKLLTVE